MTERQKKAMTLHIDTNPDALDSYALIPSNRWEETQQGYLDAMDRILTQKFPQTGNPVGPDRQRVGHQGKNPRMQPMAPRIL